uniref:Uncharacterized protein n=1 Tax=Glossina brevipalpis TaxID=37001 RepID=A0A1A9VZV8_9MUSC
MTEEGEQQKQQEQSSEWHKKLSSAKRAFVVERNWKIIKAENMILKNGFRQQDNKDTFVYPHKLSRLISIRNRTLSIYNCKHTSYSLPLCSSLTYTTGYLRRKTCHGGCCACVNVQFVLFVFINLFLKSCCGQLLINVQNQTYCFLK